MQSSCQPNTEAASEAGLERREINADPALAGPISTSAKASDFAEASDFAKASLDGSSERTADRSP